MLVGIVGLTALSWAFVLAWPGPAPRPLIVLMVLAMSASGPSSMIAFDFVRDTCSPQYLGSATGFANTGGFTASVIVILGIGALLDAQGAGTPATYTLEAFRVAMLVQFPVWGLGLWRFAVLFRRLEREGFPTRRPRLKAVDTGV